MQKFRKIVDFLLRPGETLSQKVVISGFWVFTLRIIQQIFRLTRLVILAHILAPHDFGLMGIALLTMATLETFSQPGFQAALIQKKENIESYLDAAWTFLILRGFILFAVLYSIAPYASTFFNAPEAKSIVQIIGLSILFQGFTNIGVVYFQKELEFNKQFIYQFSGTLADFIVAVSLVLILQNVWALVFGFLAGNFIKFIVSYIIHPYRPHFSVDFAKIKELFSFGKWILGSSILIFLLTQGDDIFVGKLLGTAALGMYQLAYRISNMPATEITQVISQVTFPAYSKLQDNIEKMRDAYLMVLQVITFLSFPIAGLVFVLAPDFTRMFLGERWMPMVQAMQILSIYGLIRSIGATTGPLFQAVGRPELVTKLNFMRLILIGLSIYPLTIKWSISGTSLAVLLSALIANPIAYIMVINIIGCSKLDFGKLIIVPLLGTAVMMSLFFILKFLVGDVGFLFFFIFLAVALVSYLAIVYFLAWLFGYNIEPIKNHLSAIKGD